MERLLKTAGISAFVGMTLLVSSGCSVANKVKAVVTGAETTSSSPRALAFVDSPSMDVGTIAVGATVLIRLPLSSTGSGNATITASSNSDANFTFNGGSFPGSGGTCTQPISGNCSVVLSFTGPATTGLYTDIVTLSYTSGTYSSTITLTITATVTAAAVVTINGAAPYAYGSKNVGTSTDATLTVANTGGAIASSMSFSGLSAPITYKGGTYPGTGGTCGVALGSASTCTVVITYAPTVAAVTSQTLTLSYRNGITTTTSAIAVTGTALALAAISITAPVANPYDYGNVVVGVAAGSSVTVTLSNTGGQSATSLSTSGLSAPITYKGGTYPGTGGTCGATLAASATCNIIVTFIATATGAATKTMTISYNDGSATQTLSQVFQGTGVSPATLTISDAATYDFGSHVTSVVTTHTFTVTNSGGTTATAMSGAALAAPYAYAGGTYPGTAGTCGATLAALATCTIVVTFTPSAAGTFTATLTENYNTGVSATTATRPLTGVGTLPPAALSITAPATNPYDYGTVLIGAGVDLTITISNTGGQSATSLVASGIAAPFAYAGGAYPGTTGTCGVTLAAAATCNIIVTYTPVAAVYSTRTFDLAYSDGAGSTLHVTRPIEGTGQSPALLTLSDAATYDFSSHVIATTTNHTFTVTNSGSASATAMSGAALIAPFSYAGGTYPGTAGTCGATLAASATCTIVVSFVPSAAVVSTDTLTLDYNNGVTATSATRPLTATGLLAPASLAMTAPVADPYDFGSVTIGAAGVPLTLTLANSGGQSATSLSVTGLAAPFGYTGGAFPGTTGTCGVSLGAAATCTLDVTYLPTTPGLETNTVDVAYDDGTATTIHLTHAIRGTGGNAAALSISDGATYDFGSRTSGTTTTHTFTITNGGGSTATGIAGAALSAPFSYEGGGAYPGTTGTCGVSLGAGATCTVVVSFAPVSSGGFSDSLGLTYASGVAAASTSRSLTGTGGTVANLSISDGATYSYGSVATGYSATKTFTVTNVGGAAATGISGAAFAAPYSYLGGGAFPGTGGTCAATLGAGGTCTVFVKFAPTAAAVSTDTLSISYSDSVSPATATRALTGTGATITKIVGGADHTCALYSSGVVKCWGANASGQLGNSSNTASSTPVAVTGITTATDLTAGANHSCALLANGRTYCWGADNAGQLGDNVSLTNVNSPSQVASFTDFSQISAGGDLTCGLRSGGTIACWGDDTEGGNGNDVTLSSNATPVTVSGLTSMNDVAVGRGHVCATRSDNTFRCWGSDSAGQLGDGGGNTDSGTPVTPTPGTIVTAIAGGNTSCAITNTGSVYCWGDDTYGQLGDDVAYASQSVPTSVASLANVQAARLGRTHGCAIDSTNAVICWGRDNDGQLGDDAGLANQATPVATSGMTSATVVGVGETHSCAVRSTGLAYCWGSNASGQLGDGTGPTNQATPVLVQGL